MKSKLYPKVRLLNYRGISCNGSLWIRGRLVKENTVLAPTENDSLWRNVRNSLRRVAANGLSKQKGILTVEGHDFEFETDKKGFFDLHIEQTEIEEDAPLRLDALWNFPDIPFDCQTPEIIYHINRNLPFAVISDIDDTVVHTFVEYKSQAVLRTMLGNAFTKDAIDGAPNFLNKISRYKRKKNTHYPIFYVSRSPYQIYDVLRDFFDLNDFPDGPILLKNVWLHSSYSQRNVLKEQKFNNLVRIMTMTDPMPFILVGDSAELDAIIYLNLAKQFPGRVKRIYIRRLSKGPHLEKLLYAVDRFPDKNLVCFFKYYHEIKEDARAHEFF